MGPEAVVVEPAELKVSVFKSLKETIEQYTDMSSHGIESTVFESQPKFAS